jgi:alpha(1,3/1,4) fucosyltransferase
MIKLEVVLKTIYIDPSYAAFNEDKLFDLSDPILNRDDQLLAMSRLRDVVKDNGYHLTTADRLQLGPDNGGGDYYSMGLRPDNALLQAHNIKSCGYVLMEPPVVAPDLYANLSSISKQFERVYLHNTHGNGYSLAGIRKESLRKLYWPIPYRGVLTKHWSRRDRSKKIVAINGHHKPISKNQELYSKRIEALSVFSKYDAADLYGRGWDSWLTGCNLWIPYLLNRSSLMKIFRGSSKSKYETLSGYDFCLCFENMRMDGYITEKIFDCLYAGTIPLYLGAEDVTAYIPDNIFVDCRKFYSWEDLLKHVQSMSTDDINLMRDAGKDFMQSKNISPYFHSLDNIFLNQTI